MSSVYRERNSRYLYLNTRGQWYVFDTLSPPLGFGAVGIVYIGYNVSNNCPVAIKMVRPEYSGIPFVRERAKTEAQLTFLHPNIVRMLGLCEESGDYGSIYLVSEFVNGQTFDAYSKSTLSYLPQVDRITSVLSYSISVIEALEYVHTAGVIHRDVKPSNIMVTYEGVPKLMDLGIAGLVNSDKLDGNEFMGTALYAAPELIKGESIDRRTDIYAMGVTIFEMLAGYNPFSAPSQDEILANQCSKRLPEVESIPPELMIILRRSTEKKKLRRYQRAKQFAEDLKDFLFNYAPNPI